jgi:hypothetical protein
MKMVLKRGAGLLLLCLSWGCGGSPTNTPTAADPPGNYSTSFPSTENPISEGGKWVNGGDIGLDWANVSTTPGRAIGNQTGPDFSDATAVLQNMNWAPDQKVTAQVSTIGSPLDNCFQEVEVRLRTAISAHKITGYEILFKFSTNSSGYMDIVRWNGDFGDFTILQHFTGEQFGVTNGDTVSATIVGNVITAFKNGVQQGQATDSTFSSGSPGMGFNLSNGISGCPGTNGNYGFSSFNAVDTTKGSF